jgi:hypothetical protein
MPSKGKLCREFNHSLTLCWFKVTLSSGPGYALNELVEWCEDNCTSRFTHGGGVWGLSKDEFWFKRENDSTQFKLVWFHE